MARGRSIPLIALTLALAATVRPAAAVPQAFWLASKPAKPPASPTAGPGLFEHSYFDVLPGKGSRGLIFYSLDNEDGKWRIAVVLKDPQNAQRVPQVAPNITVGGKTLAQHCGATTLLTFESLGKESPNMAAYTLGGCTSEAKALWLARQLSEAKEMTSLIDIAGVLVRHADEPGRFLLVDEILVDLLHEIALPISNDDQALLQAVGLEFRALDPFDHRRGLVRAVHGTTPTTRSPLASLDLLSCVLAGDLVDCLKAYTATQPNLQNRYKRTLRLLGGGTAATPEDALRRFLSLTPILLRPTLVAVAPKAPRAGFDAWLAAEQKKENDLSATISFSSTSNETREEDSARLKVIAKANKGTYPGQLRTTLGAQVEFGQDEFEEEVTSLQVSYDHYFRPWLEVYGFVERFSNSFLGIEQRWEGGGGMLFEGEWRGDGRDTFCYRQGLTDGYRGDEVKVTKRTSLRLEQWRAKIRQELLRTGNVSPATAADYCKYHAGVVKRNAVLQYGVALSVFADFEQPKAITIEPVAVDAEGKPLSEEQVAMIPQEDRPESMELMPASSEWPRLTVRPTLTWRPSNDVEIDASYYLKFALDSDDELDTGRQDRRSALAVNVSLAVSAKDPKVSLTGSWTQYRDTQPPRLSAAAVHEQFGVAGEAPAPLAESFIGTIGDGTQRFEFSGFSAAGRHTVVEFGVEVGF